MDTPGSPSLRYYFRLAVLRLVRGSLGGRTKKNMKAVCRDLFSRCLKLQPENLATSTINDLRINAVSNVDTQIHVHSQLDLMRQPSPFDRYCAISHSIPQP